MRFALHRRAVTHQDSKAGICELLCLDNSLIVNTPPLLDHDNTTVRALCKYQYNYYRVFEDI